MNSRWAIVIAAALVAFASFAITWQVRHHDDVHEAYSSLALSLLRGKQLSGISNVFLRSSANIRASGTGWYYDLVLPGNARVFMTDMTGPTNNYKIGYYHWVTYYLFPREGIYRHCYPSFLFLERVLAALIPAMCHFCFSADIRRLFAAFFPASFIRFDHRTTLGLSRISRIVSVEMMSKSCILWHVGQRKARLSGSLCCRLPSRWATSKTSTIPNPQCTQ